MPGDSSSMSMMHEPLPADSSAVISLAVRLERSSTGGRWRRCWGWRRRRRRAFRRACALDVDERRFGFCASQSAICWALTRTSQPQPGAAVEPELGTVTAVSCSAPAFSSTSRSRMRPVAVGEVVAELRERLVVDDDGARRGEGAAVADDDHVVGVGGADALEVDDARPCAVLGVDLRGRRPVEVPPAREGVEVAPGCAPAGVIEVVRATAANVSRKRNERIVGSAWHTRRRSRSR